MLINTLGTAYFNLINPRGCCTLWFQVHFLACNFPDVFVLLLRCFSNASVVSLWNCFSSKSNVLFSCIFAITTVHEDHMHRNGEKEPNIARGSGFSNEMRGYHARVPLIFMMILALLLQFSVERLRAMLKSCR